MKHIRGQDRQQLTMFPESIDEYVGSENMVRVIDLLVDRLDLGGLGFVEVAPVG